ncbi:MAG TPA: hypothetical protein VFX48_05705 [Saprospiraceae bacterium]|nr:hypothetical protein [Saprospiraceae bacterium]
MTEQNGSRRNDWLLFLGSTAITVLLLWFFPAWFWVGLPFVLTYLTKALNAL